MRQRTRRMLWLLGLAVISFILHNAIYGLFEVEEPVFFLLTLFCAVGFVGSAIYSVGMAIKMKRGKR